MRKTVKGQVLILVLLIVVVALAVGLSVASRNISNLKTSSQTEQSQRAFFAAEGGIEDVLSKLSQVAGDIANNTTNSGCVVASGHATCNVTVSSLNAVVIVTPSNFYQSTIELGTVGQVDLRGAAGQTIKIEWAKKSDSVENANPASLEVTQVSGGPPYTQTRTAWKGGSALSGGGNCSSNECGFSAPTACATIYYNKCTTVIADSGALSLRIRPLWAKATVNVSVSGAQFLNVQTYTLVSTAATDSGVSRKVLVTRTALPTLPAAFDFALFSSGDILK